MGYYTTYNLQVRAPDMSRDLAAEIEAALKAAEVIGYAFGHHHFSEDKTDVTRSVIYFDCCDAVKWYEHEDVMTEISKKFPSATFLLQGEGEDRDDQWEQYYLNGEMEACYPEIIWHKPTRIKWPPDHSEPINASGILDLFKENNDNE